MWLAISIYIVIHRTIFLKWDTVIYSKEKKVLNLINLLYIPSCIYTIYYFLQHFKLI